MSASKQIGAELFDAAKSALERCYSPEQIAELWALSSDTVRRIFEHEAGVLAIEAPRIYGKRRYRTLRIPESVARRVYYQRAIKTVKP